MRIGERIKYFRKRQNMSADELGAKINKSRATIYRYEKGEIENLPIPVLVPLARALNVTPADLLDTTEPPAQVKMLSRQDSSLLDDFHKLNDAGRAIAAGAVKSLTLNPEYTVKEKESSA